MMAKARTPTNQIHHKTESEQSEEKPYKPHQKSQKSHVGNPLLRLGFELQTV